MDLMLHVPDELAATLRAAGANPEMVALDALRKAADALEHISAAAVRHDATGAALIDALQASPARNVDLTPERGRATVRDVVL